MSDKYARVGDKEWCQSCLKRRVNKGYTKCLRCQQGKTDIVDYYKLGYKHGYLAQKHERFSFGVDKAWDIYKKTVARIPDKYNYDYYTGFLDGIQESEEQYSMDAAYGFDW